MDYTLRAIFCTSGETMDYVYELFFQREHFTWGKEAEFQQLISTLCVWPLLPVFPSKEVFGISDTKKKY